VCSKECYSHVEDVFLCIVVEFVVGKQQFVSGSKMNSMQLMLIGENDYNTAIRVMLTSISEYNYS
jgi:hypothetical protein